MSCQDMRQPFVELPDSELFYLACAESANELRVGAIVRGNVLWETQSAFDNSNI